MRLRPPTVVPVLVLLAAAAVVLPVTSGRPAVVVPVLAVLLLVAAPLVLPRLDVHRDHVDVRGVLRRHVVPWARVRAVRQGWFVVLDLDDGRSLRVLAAPVVPSMVAFRTWSVGDDDLFLRDSTWQRTHPGASSSLWVEVLESSRSAAPVPTGPVPPVRSGWRLAVPGLRRTAAGGRTASSRTT